MREQPWDNLKERGGTPFTKAHDPEGNWDLIDEKITETTAATASAAANTLKTAMLTNATAGAGAKIDLAEPTAGGTSKVTMQAPALAADRTIIVPDADVNLGTIATNTSSIGTNATAINNIIDGTTARTGVIVNTQNVGIAGTGVVAEEVGDGMHHITLLTLTDVDLGAIAGAGNLAIGAQIYEFPAGAHWYKVGYFGVGFQGELAIQADTPDVGIGSELANGAVDVLGGTATFEDYVNGFAATDCNGTLHDVGPVISTAGFGAGIALNTTAGAKTVFLNAAANWTGASASLLASGNIVLIWDTVI